MKDKNTMNPFFSVFFYFIILVFFNILNAMVNSSQLSPAFSNSSSVGNSFNINQKDIKNNNVNDNAWQNISSNSNFEISTRQFNWQQRKVLKQKAYKIYSNLNMVIEDINDIIAKFTFKIEKIKQVILDFNNSISLKCNQLDEKYYNLNQLIYYINFWSEKINEFKKSVYYNLHKDFRKKIDAESQNFENINNMIRHYQNSVLKVYSLETILINGVAGLNAFQKMAIEYEDKAWSKYQQLDELINDKIAESNFLEINNCSDNAILINTYLRSEFLDFFNQNMINLNNATNLILVAIDDLIAHINRTNRFIDNLELEIKVYDENKKKEKIAQELEAKILMDTELKLKNEKKIRELKLIEEQKSWIEKFSPFIVTQFNKVKLHAFNIYDLVINALIYYYNIIFNNSAKKNNAIIEKKVINNVESIPLSNEISPIVSKILPLTADKPADVVLFTSPMPEANKINSIVEDLNIKKNPFDANSDNEIPGETKIDDVFNISHEQGYNQEKNKQGASSYPNKIIISQENSVVNKNINQVDPNLPIMLLSSEDIILPEQKDSTEKEVLEKNSFKYMPSDVGNLGEVKEDKLLPNLSDLEHQKVNNVSTQGIDQGRINQVFQASSSSEKSKARTRVKSSNETNNENNKNNLDNKNIVDNISIKKSSGKKNKQKKNKFKKNK